MSKQENQVNDDNEKEIAVDANDVINILSSQVANLTKELAISQSQNKRLRSINEKQDNVIKAYEKKEKLSAK